MGADGIHIFNGQSGGNLTVDGLTIGGTTAPGQHGIYRSGGTSDFTFAINNTTIANTGTNFEGILINGTGGGTVTGTSFNNNTVTTTSGTGSGVVFDSVRFDADPGTAGFQTVNGGNLNGGQGATVGGAGLALTNMTGDLAFDALNITSIGAGFNVAGTAPFNGPAETGFRLSTTSGNVNSTPVSGVLFD